jgi:hypothetical protein
MMAEPARTPPATGGVVALAPVRIARALKQRERYRYVQPRVERLDDGADTGWKVVSPNCSRQVDAGGGEIDIAWFVQGADRSWRLHARDHGNGHWRLVASGLTMDEAITRVCLDPLREYWQ